MWKCVHIQYTYVVHLLSFLLPRAFWNWQNICMHMRSHMLTVESWPFYLFFFFLLWKKCTILLPNGLFFPFVCIIWIIYRPSALLCIINITYNRITLKIDEIHQAISELWVWLFFSGWIWSLFSSANCPLYSRVIRYCSHLTPKCNLITILIVTDFKSLLKKEKICGFHLRIQMIRCSASKGYDPSFPLENNSRSCVVTHSSNSFADMLLTFW